MSVRFFNTHVSKNNCTDRQRFEIENMIHIAIKVIYVLLHY